MGEIQVNSPDSFSDENYLDSIHSLMDSVVENGLLEEGMLFYRKRHRGYEVLLHRRINNILYNDMELSLVKSYSIPNTDGARVLECKPVFMSC